MKKMQALAVVAAAASLFLASCGERRPAPVSEVVAARTARIAEDPADPSWAKLPAFRATLLLQDLVEPRLLTPSTPDVEVRAMRDGDRIAFRLAWSDSTIDDLPGEARFPDACAVQLPIAPGTDLPAPQMGEANRPVEITYWRASWQATRNGREDDIRSLYPNAHPDHYPFEAPPLEPGTAEQAEAARRYAPARALENRMEGPRGSTVEDLIAEGPGTLRRAPEQRSTGSGVRSGDGWAVVLVRSLPPDVSRAGRGEVAFAVWNGASDETGSRKMRTGWVPLAARDGR